MSAPALGRPAVLLDRDGTLIRERHYLARPEEVELIPGAGAAVARLRAAGFVVAVLTNQSGIGRGYFGEDDLARVHERLRALLAAEGAVLDGIYHCPHHPQAHCGCRKPEPGLLHRAARELGFDPRASWVAGDKRCDLELARRAGARAALVRTGYGRRTEREAPGLYDLAADDLPALAALLAPEPLEVRP